MTLTKLLRTGTTGGSFRLEPKESAYALQAQIINIHDTMLDEYQEKAIDLARYKKSPDGKIYGEIPKCRGVWAMATTKRRCEEELKKVLSEWIKLKMEDADRDFPVIDKIDINFLSLSGISSKTNS